MPVRPARVDVRVIARRPRPPSPRRRTTRGRGRSRPASPPPAASRPLPSRWPRRSIHTVASPSRLAVTWSWKRLWATWRIRSRGSPIRSNAEWNVALVRLVGADLLGRHDPVERRRRACGRDAANRSSSQFVITPSRKRSSSRASASARVRERRPVGHGGRERRGLRVGAARSRARRRRRAGPRPRRRGRRGTARPRPPPRGARSGRAGPRRRRSTPWAASTGRNASARPVSQSISVP